VVAINSCLDEDSESIELYSMILNQCASNTVLFWPAIDELLFNKKEYCIIRQIVKDPVAEYNQQEQKYKSMIQNLPMEKKFSKFKQSAEEQFINRVIGLIEFSKFIGDKKAVKEIKTRTLSVTDHSTIKSIETE
jgi:hypothetical protein